MEWTKEKPVKSGLYWVRHKYIDGDIITTIIDFDADYENIESAYKYGFSVLGNETPCGLDDFPDAEWYGPIEPPE
jgi:hypothetical protein